MSRFLSRASFLAILMSVQASAHTGLTKSVPADGDQSKSPTEIVLEFSEAVHLTAISITSEGKTHSLGQIPAGPLAEFSIPVTGTLAPGQYSVAWRAVSADTHVVSGDFDFVVVAGDAPESRPETAAANP